MKWLRTALILLAPMFGCKNSVDLNTVYLQHESLFKKIENPTKTLFRYRFEPGKTDPADTVFNKNYIAGIRHIFDATVLDVAYVIDGDILIGIKGDLSKLCFTNKKPDETLMQLNFSGTLHYLLQNGKSLEPPYAIQIAPSWYIVRDIQLL